MSVSCFPLRDNSINGSTGKENTFGSKSESAFHIMTAGEVANDCIERPVHPIDVLIWDTGPKLDLYLIQDCGRTWTADRPAERAGES